MEITDKTDANEEPKIKLVERRKIENAKKLFENNNANEFR